jgi:hypothetical protein
MTNSKANAVSIELRGGLHGEHPLRRIGGWLGDRRVRLCDSDKGERQAMKRTRGGLCSSSFSVQAALACPCVPEARNSLLFP